MASPQREMFEILPTAAEAAARRDRGILAASSRDDGWRDEALQFAERFIKRKPFFLTEELVASSKLEIPQPKDGRAWGAIVRRLASERRIAQAGVRRARTSNLSLKPYWQSLEVDPMAVTDPKDWLELARNYLRQYRSMRAHEGFRTSDIIAHSIKSGCSQPPAFGLWLKLIKSEGMIERDGRWFNEPCCDDCAQKKGAA